MTGQSRGCESVVFSGVTHWYPLNMHEGDAWGPWAFLWLLVGVGTLAISETVLDIWLIGSLILGALAFVYVTLIDG